AKLAPALVADDLGTVLTGLDRDRLDAGPQLSAGSRRRFRERVGQRSHPADGDQPLAAAAPDHVVEEAAVREQVVSRRERADQRVGERDSLEEVLAEALAHGLA